MWRASSLAMLAAFSPLLICVRWGGRGTQVCRSCHTAPRPSSVPRPLSPSSPSPGPPPWQPSPAPSPGPGGKAQSCLPEPLSPMSPQWLPLPLLGPGSNCACLEGAAVAGTFWATWLTQGEVQLLRSGPRGFQSPRAGRHWNEAIPVGTDGQEQTGEGEEEGPTRGTGGDSGARGGEVR